MMLIKLLSSPRPPEGEDCSLIPVEAIWFSRRLNISHYSWNSEWWWHCTRRYQQHCLPHLLWWLIDYLALSVVSIFYPPAKGDFYCSSVNHVRQITSELAPRWCYGNCYLHCHRKQRLSPIQGEVN